MDEEERLLHGLLLRQVSYSSFNELHSCERRFYLDKLISSPKSTSVDFAFGHALGAGIQSLWQTADIDSALAAAFFAWDTEFTDTKDKAKKSIAHVYVALKRFLPFYQLLSQEWSLARFNGKDTVEYSMCIEFPDGFRYRAYVDYILQNNETGEYAINEIKSDGSNMQHEAKYANSEQGLSYSLLLDQLAPGQSSFIVNYWPYYTTSQEWVPFSFPKSALDKAKWLKTVLVDMQYIQQREKDDYWPKRGSSCLSFNRPCRYFGSCGLSDTFLLSGKTLLEEKLQAEREKEYSFVVPLEKVIESYLS